MLNHSTFSSDRLSLAQEIRDVLSSRGYWVPKDFASSDLINAVAMALDSKVKIERHSSKPVSKDN